jgi:hypothetical protein
MLPTLSDRRPRESLVKAVWGTLGAIRQAFGLEEDLDAFGGSAASKNRIISNHAFKNKPADIVWDGNGNGNKFRRNRCDTSVPGGLCP